MKDASRAEFPRKKTRYGFKKEQDSLFPPMVFVEITNVCNLGCVHCPYPFVSRQNSYKPRYMDLAIYKKIADEVAQFPGAIFRFVCDGEPMLHPDFLNILRYAKQKKISPVCFNTNGMLLNEKMAREIISLGVDVVEVSIDALTKETYGRIRKGGDFEKVRSAVFNLLQERDRKQGKTKVMVSIIDQPEAAAEIDGFFKFWNSRVDRVIKRTYTTIGGMVDKGKVKFWQKQGRWPCPLPWTRVFINVDGFAKFCVEDWQDETILGDLRLSTIQDVWISSRYRSIREAHLARKFNGLQRCQECLDWPAREWNYDYFFALGCVLDRQRGKNAA